MKILLLYETKTSAVSAMIACLLSHGHEVIGVLCDYNSEKCLAAAKENCERCQPDVVVAESSTAALAVKIGAGDTPAVLLCPDWKRDDSEIALGPNVIIIHCREDEIVPFSDSEELVRANYLGPEVLIECDGGHDLSTESALETIATSILEVVRRATLVKHLERMRADCEADAKCVLPLFGIQDDKPIQDRSGVLIAIAEKRFLVTAAHHLKDITDAEIPLYVTSPQRGQGGIPIIGRLHATEEKRIDLAIVDLCDQTSGILEAAGARFLRVTDVDNREETRAGLFLIRGYPLDCNASPMTYSTVKLQGELPTDADCLYDPATHLVLDHRKVVRAGAGFEHRSPRITGMSGCGIWRLTTRPPSDLASWSPDERRLVAIQTACKYGKYLKGTKIRHVFGLIYDRCPELRRVMSTLELPISASV